jgi:hypothetical protein
MQRYNRSGQSTELCGKLAPPFYRFLHPEQSDKAVTGFKEGSKFGTISFGGLDDCFGTHLHSA